MEEIVVKKFSSFQGEVHLPGSKSIANRAILLSALCRGKTILTNLPDADDIEVLLLALLELGTDIFCISKGTSSLDTATSEPPVSKRDAQESILKQTKEIKKKLSPKGISKALYSGDALCIAGVDGQFPRHEATLNLENAGTALRPLLAALATMQGHYVVTGNDQMQRRPVGDLTRALASLGVQIQDTKGCPPVELFARGMAGGEVSISGGISSQFLSALLLAAPLMAGPLQVQIEGDLVSKPYLDLTLAVLDDFGVKAKREGYHAFFVDSKERLHSPGEYAIEGDASAATYFLGAGALPGCGPVRIEGLGSNSIQGDTGFAGLLSEMGAQVRMEKDFIEVEGPQPGQRLRALDRDLNAMPDAAMTLAVLALFCEGTTHIRNIANLRVKESERIRGLHTELEKLGARVEEEEDALHITPPKEIRPARIETYKDHRMAMAFSLAAYGADVTILDPGCVSKTYRRFFEDFLPLCQEKPDL